MLYVSIIILILLICFYLISLRHNDGMLSEIDRQEHRLYILYPMARLLLKKTGIEKKLLKKLDISRKVRALYISNYHNSQIKLYWYKKTSLLLLLIFTFSCVSMITSVKETITMSQTFEASLIRPENGEGDRNLILHFRMESNNDDDVYEDEITIKNKERVYTENEWNDVLNKAIPYLEQQLLGDNESLDYIDKDLNLIKSIPGTGITLEWIPKDYRLISSNGKLMGNDIDEATVSSITAILRYKDRKVEHIIPLTIWPAKVDNKDLLYKELQDILDITEEETKTAKEWRLPKRIGDYSLIWKIPEENLALTILLLGFIGSILLWVFMDRSLDEKIKERNKQMLLDYPDIINKFNLLVNAGMTIRQAWAKIAEDYKEKNTLRKGQVRYAYEEMLVTLNELKLGIPEANAYEQFGIRTGLMPYMKFNSLLVQNLKKGNKNMVEMLKQEAMEAFHERKENTKRIGEEASTKLLGPMMLMLLIVLIIILIPAFVNFNV